MATSSSSQEQQQQQQCLSDKRPAQQRRQQQQPKKNNKLSAGPCQLMKSKKATCNSKTYSYWKEMIQQPTTATTKDGCADDTSSTASSNSSKSVVTRLLSDKVHAATVLSLVLNAITLHRRVVVGQHQHQSSRFRCTPSLRIRQCSYHCLQILSARLLLYMAGSSALSRDQLMKEAQLRMMVEALDYTLDPQLLCLVIQTVALLALHYPYQPLLLDSGIPDALTQVILPSDEWYYTNHTTRFSRIVKHHAARALVYLGLARCLGPRVSLFEFQGNFFF
jgi:phosphatidylinositol phospholipase C epsilon